MKINMAALKKKKIIKKVVVKKKVKTVKRKIVARKVFFLQGPAALYLKLYPVYNHALLSLGLIPH